MALYDITSETDKRIVSLFEFVRTNGSNNPYHNFNHPLDVTFVAQEYCKELGLGEEVRILSVSAALTHDLVHVPGRLDNELKTCEKLKTILPSMGYDLKREVEPILNAVMATNPPVGPKNLLEQIIVDSDLDNLGREDFFEKGSLLRAEAKMAGKEYSDSAWLTHSLNFLSSHRYHTDMAKKRRNAGKDFNITELMRKLA